MSSNLVIIPTYNEKENIKNIIEAVFNLKEAVFDILVVDDNSPDGTRAIVKDLQTEFPGRLFLLERQNKEGLGKAYLAGFAWALYRNYDYITEMDADFSHNPNDLPKLLSACINQNAGLCIGSRYVSGVNVVNWPMKRVLMSFFASKYVNFITSMNIRDTTAGFVCYKSTALKKIIEKPIKFVGYAFQIEMKFKAFKYGFKIIEVPIIFIDRTKGESKMSNKIFWEAAFGVLNLKFNSFFKKYN